MIPLLAAELAEDAASRADPALAAVWALLEDVKDPEIPVVSVRELGVLRARGPVDAGAHELVWDGRDDAGHDVGSGVYLVRLSSGEQSFSRKIVLLR